MFGRRYTIDTVSQAEPPPMRVVRPYVSRPDRERRPQVQAPVRRLTAAPEGSMQKVYRALGITFLFLLAVYATALAQGMQVSGTVTSATTHEKLWGATVRVRGTQTQTVTDRQGRYALVAPADAVLTYAIIGYRGTERPV